MNDPARIVDDGNEWAREILRSARVDVPSEQFRRRLARRLGVASAAVGLSAAGSAKAVGTGLWLKWMAAGALTGLVTIGGATAVVSRREAKPVASAALRPPVRSLANESARGDLGSQPAAREAMAPAVANSASQESSVAPKVELRVDSRAGNAPRGNSHLPTSQVTQRESNALPASTAEASRSLAAPSASSGATTLVEELALINSVRAALENSAAQAALRSLDEYASKYPNGRLSTEALVLRVSAFAALGDRASAKRLAEELLATDPDSPYAQRLRSLANPGARP